MADVDIILPVFNARERVAAVLTSVAAQTCLDRLHLIIVDDGSTDGTLDAVADTLIALPALEQRSEIISLGKNCGASAAFSAGLGAARSEWIGRCDDDDFLPSDALQRLLHKAEMSGADVVAGAAERRCGSRSTVLRPQLGDLNKMSLNTVNFALWNKLIRRSALFGAPDGKALGTLKGINCWDDLSLTARILALPGIRTACLGGEPVYIYNVLPGRTSLSRSAREYVLAQHIECAELLDRWFNDNGLAATFAPFLLRLKFIAKVKLLRGAGRFGRIREWQRTFPETTPYILSQRVMGPDVSLPLRIAFRFVAAL